MSAEDDRERDLNQPGGGPRSIIPANRYSAAVGLLFLVLAGVALFNVLTSSEPGTLGFGYDERGAALEPFAVPEARSELDGDANINPDQACEVEVEGAIRICDYFDRPLVISFWFDRSDCVAQQDLLSDLAGEYRGRLATLSVNVRDDRDHVRELANRRGWRMPVGHDRDGAVSNLYRVGGCPTLVFAMPGGRLFEAMIGEVDAEQLERAVERLITASEGTAPPGSPD